MKTHYKPIFAASSIAAVATLALATSAAKSGLQPGEMVSAFEPTHVTGPDANSTTCPVCKYGATPAVQLWINGDTSGNVAGIAKELEAAIKMQGADKLKAFVIFIKPEGVSAKSFSDQLAETASKNGLKNVALTYVDGARGAGVEAYKINLSADVKNTIMVYHDRKVSANFVNLKADENGLNGLKSAMMNACGMDH